MFTKHLEGLEIPEIITALQSVGVSGADLCVRPGYPVNPENATEALPAAAKQLADAGLSIPLITTPGDFLDPAQEETRRVYAAAGEAGCRKYQTRCTGIGTAEDGGYWAQVDFIRSQLEGFGKLSEQYGPRTCIHNHSGTSMGLNSCAVMNLVKGFSTRNTLAFLPIQAIFLLSVNPINMALDIVKSHLAVYGIQGLGAFSHGARGGSVVRMGKGFVDWKTTVNTLQTIGYSGPVSFHSEYSGEPVDTVIDLARVDVRFITGLLEK